MKGPAPDAARVLAEQRFDSAEHFTRDAISDRARLTRSGSGDNQNRPRARAGDRPLLFVQGFAVIHERCARRVGFDDEFSRHRWLKNGSGEYGMGVGIFRCHSPFPTPYSLASRSLMIAVCLIRASGWSVSP